MHGVLTIDNFYDKQKVLQTIESWLKQRYIKKKRMALKNIFNEYIFLIVTLLPEFLY